MGRWFRNGPKRDTVDRTMHRGARPCAQGQILTNSERMCCVVEKRNRRSLHCPGFPTARPQPWSRVPLVFGTAGSTTKRRVPILCALCKGWDTRPSVSRFVISHPSQKARRTPDFLLRGPSHGRSRRKLCPDLCHPDRSQDGPCGPPKGMKIG